jgi:MFS family permease
MPVRALRPRDDEGRESKEEPRRVAEPTPPEQSGGPPHPGGEPPHPSSASQRGLDWFIFFVADVQTGFGPFIAVYLTSQKWTQVDIGLVLSIGGIVSLIAQMPGGLLVDAARSERLVAGVALVAIATSAMAYALMPVFPVVLSAAVMHALASCVLGPCIVAISLGLVGHAGIGARLGRNARFASIGNGIAAAAMGACGYFFSPRAVFVVTAAMLIPSLLALHYVRPAEIDPVLAHGGAPVRRPEKAPVRFSAMVRKPALLILAGCVMLFHMANAAMLPLMGSVLTMRSAEWATVLIGACIVVPQLVVAALSPWVGHHAQIWGRRPFMLIAFTSLPIRGLLFATVTDPTLLVAVQVLDGITAASLGVMVPLMVADLTRGTGRFNLAQGVVGTAMGIGASISPTLGGVLTDGYGSSVAFLGLAGVAVLGFSAVWLFLPETRLAAHAATR